MGSPESGRMMSDNGGPHDTRSNPLSFLTEWAKANPQAAPIVMGAIACFAAAAVIGQFGIDLQASIPNVFYILGIGVFLLVLARVVSNELMMRALAWFLLGLVVCWILAFIIHRSAPISVTSRQQLGCVVYFWKDCVTVADNEAQRTAPAPSAAGPLAAPEAGTDVDPRRYTVFVQFAGSLQRDAVRSLMQQLQSQGWKVQGVDGGGQRTAAAAGFSEIRYPPGNEAAAKALAAVVQSSKLSARPIGLSPNSSILKDVLEVWISR
jgi:hypothetical protein